MGPHPAVAAVRLAVRRSLADLEPGTRLLVACSGGADSLALVAATVFESREPSHDVTGLTVDHGLQQVSTAQAARVVEQMRGLGVTRAESVVAEVGTAGGPEAAARSARYAALDRAASEHKAEAVLLGHTRDDQAETVLLGLARGSGTRSLAGMPTVSRRYRRPLLDVTRGETVAACHAEGISFWVDPHNENPAFARARVRAHVLPVLEEELGPGARDALARTARLLGEDAEALEQFSAAALAHARDRTGGLSVERLTECVPAVRRRVLRRAAVDAGCPATELFLVHVDAVDALVTAWRGQRGVDLPGHIRAQRAGGTLRFVSVPVAV